MSKTINLVDLNIANLTSLWKTACIPFDSYVATPHFNYCEISNSDWPNRLWFNGALTQEKLDLAKEKLLSTPFRVSIPHFSLNEAESTTIFEENGFKITFEQVGMALKLGATAFKTNNDIKIKLVSNILEAEKWADLFKESFRYKMGVETIFKTPKNINYYIAYHNNDPVGTIVSHKTNNVLGLHSLGIPPEMRRKGYAEQIMKLLINLAVKDGNDYVTLQASDMGKNLYLKLGFEEHFLIKNYVLQTKS